MSTWKIWYDYLVNFLWVCVCKIRCKTFASCCKPPYRRVCKICLDGQNLTHVHPGKHQPRLAKSYTGTPMKKSTYMGQILHINTYEKINLYGPNLTHVYPWKINLDGPNLTQFLLELCSYTHPWKSRPSSCKSYIHTHENVDQVVANPTYTHPQNVDQVVANLTYTHPWKRWPSSCQSYIYTPMKRWPSSCQCYIYTLTKTLTK